MSVLDRVSIPRRLSARVWLITLPSALISFERRSNVPKLPVGSLRYAGVPLIAGGIALAIWGSRRPESTIELRGPASRLPHSPATIGGLLVLAGASLLLRSTVLAAYALGLTVAAGTNVMTIEQPEPSLLLGREDGD